MCGHSKRAWRGWTDISGSNYDSDRGSSHNAPGSTQWRQWSAAPSTQPDKQVDIEPKQANDECETRVARGVRRSAAQRGRPGGTHAGRRRRGASLGDCVGFNNHKPSSVISSIDQKRQQTHRMPVSLSSQVEAVEARVQSAGRWSLRRQNLQWLQRSRR